MWTRSTVIFVVTLLVLLGAVTIMNRLPAAHPLHVGTFTVTLLGKYLTYAILAVAVDLVWGFLGILSLGHAAFFALGGYAMGMYLMRQIGARGVYGNPELPDFMVFLNWTELPWYWMGFDSLLVRRADGHRGAGAARLRVRLVRVPLARRRGVPVDHHPGADLRADARLLPQRDGLRRQQRPDRLPRAARLRPALGRDAARPVPRLRGGAAVRLPALRAILASRLGRVARADPRRGGAARAFSATASSASSSRCSRCRP